MDGHPRQNPAYRPATGEAPVMGLFLFGRVPGDSSWDRSEMVASVRRSGEVGAAVRPGRRAVSGMCAAWLSARSARSRISTYSMCAGAAAGARRSTTERRWSVAPQSSRVFTRQAGRGAGGTGAAKSSSRRRTTTSRSTPARSATALPRSFAARSPTRPRLTRRSIRSARAGRSRISPPPTAR